MAKPSTTHVIEIETGIGEPTFIPLTLGHELQPISVGKKGMWRIESARVLDVHAFVYFDGASLFFQSADDSVTASVDGYRVGKAWTELHAPCKIELGAATLRFRSLMPDAAAEPPQAAAAPRRRVDTGSQVWQRPELPQAPLSFPKVDRPFAPGEPASSTPQGESTRVAPLENARNAHAPMSPDVPHVQRPAAGRGPEEATRVEGTGRRRANTGVQTAREDASGPPPPMPSSTAAIDGGAMMTAPMAGGAMGRPPGMPLQHPWMSTVPGPPMHPVGPSMPGGTIPPIQPGMSPPGRINQPTDPRPPYSGPGIARPYDSMGVALQQIPSGTYGSMTALPPAPTGGGLSEYIARYKELSPPRRLLVTLAPFCLVASGYLILFDHPEPTPGPAATAAVDAGTEASLAVNTPPGVGSHALPPARCPPGFVPWQGPATNGAIACVRAGTPGAASAPASNPPSTLAASSHPLTSPNLAAGQTPPRVTPTSPTPAAPDAGAAIALSASNKTLERQAVDYVAVNDYARAAAVYETLQAQNPNNRVYAEAARILRAKANGHIP